MLLACMCFMVPQAAQAQKVPKQVIQVATEYSDYTQTTAGSQVFEVSGWDTVTNGETDTFFLKVVGGDETNILHFWNVMQKVSGTTDSETVTIWGSCDEGAGTYWKSLNSQQTANSSTTQIFDYSLTGNNYTNYMIIVKRISVLSTAQVSRYRFKVLVR